LILFIIHDINVIKINREKIIEKSFRDTGITLNSDGSDGSYDDNFLNMPKEYTENMNIDINDEEIENNNK